MNDLLDHDTRDDDIRDLIAQARADAPAPTPWHEVVERRDVERDRPRWAVLGVAATVVALGALGLVVALQARGGSDDNPADDPAPPTPAPSETVAPTGEADDPLADLTEDDWLVPTGELPDGYEVLAAVADGSSDRDGAPGPVIVGGDAVEPITATNGTDPFGEEVGPYDVAGVEWRLFSLAPADDGADYHMLFHRVGVRAAVVEGFVDPELLAAVASTLVGTDTLPDDVPLVSRDGQFVDVTSRDDVILAVQGTNGIYCWELRETLASRRTVSCNVVPTATASPIVEQAGAAFPEEPIVWGTAEPDVARIEFVGFDGEVYVAEPVDASGQFDRRFWIASSPGVGSAVRYDRATITYDDGSTAIAEPRAGGVRWEIIASFEADQPVDPLARFDPDDWVVPSSLPEGYELLVAARFGSDTDGRVVVGGDDVDEISINEGVGGGGDELESIDIGGVEWQMREMIDEDGVRLGVGLQRDANGHRIYVETRGELEPAMAVAGSLVPIAEAELPIPVLEPDAPYTEVGTIGDSVLSAQGANSIYCVRIMTPGGSGGGSCASRVEPATPVVQSGGYGDADGSYATGVADGHVARIEFLRPTANENVVVEPVDESGEFEDRFWATDQSLAVAEQAIITYDDDTTATIERTPGGAQWTLADGR